MREANYYAVAVALLLLLPLAASADVECASGVRFKPTKVSPVTLYIRDVRLLSRIQHDRDSKRHSIPRARRTRLQSQFRHQEGAGMPWVGDHRRKPEPYVPAGWGHNRRDRSRTTAVSRAPLGRAPAAIAPAGDACF